MKHEEPAWNDRELYEWVMKAPRDPMVEFDPVTVFRCIVAERRASLAKTRARNEEQANLALQTGFPTSFIFGRKWHGNSGIAIAIAVVILVLTAALYMLRSTKKKHKEMEVSSADTNDILGLSSNGRQKFSLIQDSVKAPENVPTAMAVGAASVSRPKGHMGATQGTLHSTNGNTLESQRPEGETGIHRNVNTVALGDAKTELHSKLTFEQAPNGSNILEDSIPLKFGNSGIDVTEGPWFGQGITGNDKLAPIEVEELDPEKLEEADSENHSCVQMLHLNVEECQTDGSLAENSMPAEISEQVEDNSIKFLGGKDETVCLDQNMNSGIGDREVYVQVEAEEINPNSIQTLDFKVEDLQADGSMAEDSKLSGKPKRVVEEDVIKPLKVKDGTLCPDQNMESGTVVGDFYGEAVSEQVNPHSVHVLDFKVEGDEGSQFDGNLAENSTPAENSEKAVKEDSINSLEAEYDTVNPDQNMEIGSSAAEFSGKSIGDSDDNKCHGIHFINQEGSVISLNDVNDSKGGFGAKVSNLDAAIQPSAEESREDCKKALQAAVPALAMGVGTVGAFFGVAGGLQVVGFAALASLVSRDFLWAQSRESLWQELNDITDRQKLLDFLTRRNIV